MGPTLHAQATINGLAGCLVLQVGWGNGVDGTLAWGSDLCAGVPAMYLLGRSLFVTRAPALLSATTFLTLLPVARHGRLLMLDGMSVTAFLVMLLCVARCSPMGDRHSNPRWAIGIGLALGWIVLTKGLLAVPLGAIAFAWMLWQYRLAPLQNGWFYVGFCLGLGAVSGWYGAQFHQYGRVFWQTHFLTQGLDRLSESVERHRGPLWYYGLELLKYAWPWLVFWPQGLQLAWQDRNQRWGSLVLVGTVGYFSPYFGHGDQTPVVRDAPLSIYGLSCGGQLAAVWQGTRRMGRGWAVMFACMGGIVLTGGIYFGVEAAGEQWMVPLMGVVWCGTFAIAAGTIWQQKRRFIPILILGTYIGLVLLMLSGEWLWELNEAFDVRPVAEMVRSQVPPNSTLYGSLGYERPALNFYCHCKILPASQEQLLAEWPHHYLLLDRAVWPQFQQAGAVPLNRSEEFILVAPQLPGLESVTPYGVTQSNQTGIVS